MTPAEAADRLDRAHFAEKLIERRDEITTLQHHARAATPSAAPASGDLADSLARIQGALVRERDGWAHSVPVRDGYDRVLNVLDEEARRPAPRGEGATERVDAGYLVDFIGGPNDRWHRWAARSHADVTADVVRTLLPRVHAVRVHRGTCGGIEPGTDRPAPSPSVPVDGDGSADGAEALAVLRELVEGEEHWTPERDKAYQAARHRARALIAEAVSVCSSCGHTREHHHKLRCEHPNCSYCDGWADRFDGDGSAER